MKLVMTESDFRKIKRLENLKSLNRLEDFIISDILNHDEPLAYIENVLMAGGINGAIDSLIYYPETRDFFNKYETEITDRIFEELAVIDLKPHDVISNKLSWFAYELVVNDIKNYLKG